MLRTIVAIAIACGAAAAAAQTIDPKKANDLMAKAACAACHSLDRKGVGPAYKEVAKKYKGDAKAADAMAMRIRKGSQGIWGQIPMPPNPADKISDDEVKQMVAYILSL